MARRLQRITLIALAFLAFLAAITALIPQGRAAYNTALFITQVVPALPEVRLFQPKVLRQRVEVMTPEGSRQADLYRSGRDKPSAGVVLFLGVAPAGPDDPRVVNLSEGLARANLVTLVYWSPDKMEERLHPPDIQNLVAAYRYLQSQPFVDPKRTGFAGFCVGASFALMAAAQPEIRDEVAFVNAFGPYYDLYSLARAIGARSRQTDAGQVPWEMDPLTERVARGMLLSPLPTDEQEAVQDALESGGKEPAGVSQEALAVYRILAGGSAEEVDAALVDLPQAAHDLFRAASPSQYLQNVQARVLLMHDRADNLVPSWESRLVYEALKAKGNVRYTEFSLFQHMDPTRRLGWWETAGEVWKLFRHMYAIMRQGT